MSQVTLEVVMQRLEKLEQTVNRLLEKKGLEPMEFKDWRLGIGLMPGGDDEFHKQIDEAGRQLREEERRAAIEVADREDAEQQCRPIIVDIAKGQENAR